MNKYLMRLCSVMLTVALICGVVSVPAMAADSVSDKTLEGNDDTSTELEGLSDTMTSLDVIVAASLVLNSDVASEDMLPPDSVCNEIIPLYNIDGDVVAYYVSFSPAGYAVINNNLDNPVPIEFGKNTQKQIQAILDLDSTPHIVYSDPFAVYNGEMTSGAFSSSSDSVDENGLHDYYPELLVENSAAVADFNEQMTMLQERYPRLGLIRGDGDYGFIDVGDLPSGSYASRTIINATGVEWATTGEYSDIASNHCGATAVTNLALYFVERGESDLLYNGDKDDTFEAVHDIVGNGPVMTIAGSASEYFDDQGVSLNYSSVGTTSSYKTAIDNNRPVGLLLAEGIVSWHWILGVGYRNYTSGSMYFRIVDGWYDNMDSYYLPHSGSLWMSATQYWV